MSVLPALTAAMELPDYDACVDACQQALDHGYVQMDERVACTWFSAWAEGLLLYVDREGRRLLRSRRHDGGFDLVRMIGDFDVPVVFGVVSAEVAS